MVCAICHWWRVSPETPTEDDVPTFGRCIARPPSPAIFAVADVDEWNEKTLAVVWPQTLPDDHCSAFVFRDLIDQETGRPKLAVMPDDEETMQ